MVRKKKVGILALQGDFEEHAEAIRKLGHSPLYVKLPQELKEVEGLIIPGGESTTFRKLMKDYGFYKVLAELKKENFPIFGTCAGIILLAKEVIGEEENFSLGFINIAVERNAYGRQIESFEGEVHLTSNRKKILGVFIRAPRIRKVGEGVKVLGHFENEPVLVAQGNFLGATFHPELTEDLYVHSLFTKTLEEKGDV